MNNLLPDQQVTHFQQDDSELGIEINLFQRKTNLAISDGEPPVSNISHETTKAINRS